MHRERLTITLKKDLLKQLDAAIDGDKIRNRSHAIEYFLSQSLTAKSVKVLILAGGKGVKFRPLTYELPKAMIPVKGKPLLEHTLNKLSEAGLRDVTISVGHLGEKIKDYFGDGSKWNLKINYLQQPKTGGTAQALLQAKNLFSENFLVLYGDVISNINFLDLADFHIQQKQIACTMALVSVEKPSMWGVAKLVGNKIFELDEKPVSPKTHSHLVNAGVYMMHPSIFKYIGSKSLKLEHNVFPRLAEEGKLAGYVYEGQWYDVSGPEIYERVLKEWEN